MNFFKSVCIFIFLCLASVVSNAAYVPSSSLTTSQISTISSSLTNTYALKSFGAYGDAQFANGVLASNGITTVCVTQGHFVSSDAGSYIGLFGNGTNRTTWWTTIAAVNNNTQIVLSAAAPISYNYQYPDPGIKPFTLGTYCVYGAHDDSGPIQAWLNQVTNGGGIFDPGVGNYLILNPPQLTNQNNAQIIIPVPGWNMASSNSWQNVAPVMHLVGPEAQTGWGDAYNFYTGWFKPAPHSTFFISNLQGLNWTGTNLVGASVFDFRGYNPGNAFVSAQGYGAYAWPNNNVQPDFENFNLLCGYDANCVGLNFMGTVEIKAKNLYIYGGNFGGEHEPAPLGTNGWAIITPLNYNGVGGDLRNCGFQGFMHGMDAGVVKGDYLSFSSCSNAITINFMPPGCPQKLSNLQFYACPIWADISGNGISGGSGGSQLIMDVIFYASQNTPNSVPQWETNVCGVYDPSNYSSTLGGSLTYYTTGQGSVPTNVLASGSNFKVIKLNTQSGGFEDGRSYTLDSTLSFNNTNDLYLYQGNSGWANRNMLTLHDNNINGSIQSDIFHFGVRPRGVSTDLDPWLEIDSQGTGQGNWGIESLGSGANNAGALDIMNYSGDNVLGLRINEVQLASGEQLNWLSASLIANGTTRNSGIGLHTAGSLGGLEFNNGTNSSASNGALSPITASSLSFNATNDLYLYQGNSGWANRNMMSIWNNNINNASSQNIFQFGVKPRGNNTTLDPFIEIDSQGTGQGNWGIESLGSTVANSGTLDILNYSGDNVLGLNINEVQLASGEQLNWFSSSVIASGATRGAGIGLRSTGVLEVNNGTNGIAKQLVAQFTSTNNFIGISATVPVWTNTTDTHGFYLQITNGIIVGTPAF